jgi:hypothetical protein
MRFVMLFEQILRLNPFVEFLACRLRFADDRSNSRILIVLDEVLSDYKIRIARFDCAVFAMIAGLRGCC